MHSKTNYLSHVFYNFTILMVARLVTVYVLHDTQGTAHSLSSMSILASLSLRLAFTLLVSAADRYKRQSVKR